MPRRTTAAQIAQSETVLKCLELRLSGKSYQQIARATGWTPTRVHRQITLALDRAAALTQDAASHLRTLAIERLDVMLQGIWPRVIMGDDQAIQAALKIEERRAKLAGLDAPNRQELSGPGGIPLQLDMGLLAQAEERLKRLESKLGTLPMPEPPPQLAWTGTRSFDLQGEPNGHGG